MGIILFPYFNSTKGVKKTVASGKSRTHSSISPNFALRKYEKLNNLLPQFFCDYTSRHLIDTYSSFCVVEGGDIFSHTHVLLFFFFFLPNRLRAFNHVTDAVRLIYQILGQSNFALRKLSYFLYMHKALRNRLP